MECFLNALLDAARAKANAPLKLFFATLLFLVSACGNETPRLTPLAADAVVLSFGDSLTHGTGATPAQSYPAILAELIGREVARAGVPGEVSASGLSRLPRELDKHSPALVILCRGGNDMLRKLSPTALEQNLKSMIADSRASGAQVLLVGVPKPAILGLGTAEVYRKIAAEMAVPLLDDTLADILGDNALKSDHIHPNAAGYAVLAQAIAALLRQAGAI